MIQELYPSINEQHLQSLKPALCKDKIQLSSKVKKDIETIVDEFVALKRKNTSTFQNSVLNCLDFHYSSEKLKIIEANTNASGYLVTHLLEENKDKVLKYEDILFKSFQTVFKEDKPEPLYIIDEDPTKEKMYPEFLMFKDMFERFGLSEVKILKTKDLPLDHTSYVYNRDTDFYFEKSPAILEAFEENKIRLSTSPVTYQNLASKKNSLNSIDSEFPNLDSAVLKSYPFSPELWEGRKRFFFKPTEMYGGKGVYAGKSLSRKKFESLDDQYIAQEAHPPGKIALNGEEWKYDIRAFFSEAKVQKIVVRIYQGQLTNFSNIGGGFALIDWV